MSESFLTKISSEKSEIAVKTIEQKDVFSYVQSANKNKEFADSHLCFFELPDKTGLRILADCSFCISPNSENLIRIIQHTIKAFSACCLDTPKIAILSANEKVSSKVLSTQLAKETAEKMSNIPDVIVEGPVSFDLAISSKSAKIKKYSGKINGDANILIAPRADSANLLMQSLKHIAKAETAEILFSNSEILAIVPNDYDIKQKKYASVCIAQLLERKKNV